MAGGHEELGEAQRRHWEQTYTAHPGMYGEVPSAPAVHAAGVFRSAAAQNVLELGSGHGRDALYFAREGFTVQATDFSGRSGQFVGHRAYEGCEFGLGGRIGHRVG
ncbi:hypothetical protein [Streptomyces sp. S465]|uniref:hypothetical protein n=1 Tax=Streptomyces sp. S465 TaxID=2979468 RepID=UPI0022A83A3B|nr:hypothetical protein [Streptomyces sp. S465]WAP60573.1 hypothetical protein N6H00_39495 [Streptomyces sp. S465]